MGQEHLLLPLHLGAGPPGDHMFLMGTEREQLTGKQWPAGLWQEASGWLGAGQGEVGHRGTSLGACPFRGKLNRTDIKGPLKSAGTWTSEAQGAGHPQEVLQMSICRPHLLRSYYIRERARRLVFLFRLIFTAPPGGST